MITTNIDSAFIQIKSVFLQVFTWQNEVVAEVAKMSTQLRKEASRLDLLANAVDETLKHVFKEDGVKVIYGFLENKCHLKRGKFAEKPEAFSSGLKRLLGSAAPVIEKAILESLYSKCHLEYVEKDGYRFSDYIKELRERCVDNE